MPAPAVLVCDPTYPLARVRELLPGAQPGSVADADADTVALLVSPDAPVSAGDFERLPGVRIVATASVGFDHIDMDAARERGVEVVNVPDYCTEEVADHALALALALLRGLPGQDRAVQRGHWDEDMDAGGVPWRIAGRRVAVLGMGRIGHAFAEKARALRMEVRFYDPYVAGGEVDLDELLAWADAVSLHMPLTPETDGLLDARRLDLMRPGTVLVNTARGRLVDREALKAATHLRCGLDTVWERPPRDDLLGLPHLVLTPYVAWYSPETKDAPYLRAAEAVASALADGA